MSEVHEKNNVELFVVGNESINQSLTSSDFRGKKRLLKVWKAIGSVCLGIQGCFFCVSDRSTLKLVVVMTAKLYEYTDPHWTCIL